MPSKDNSNAEERFNWLRREDRGPNYISYSESSDRQACSFDFGDNGCSASCDYGGELLNMSSKDEEEGIIFATSGLENTYRSSLDHAQRHSGGGGKAIFGLRIAVDQEPFHKVDLKDRGSRLKLGQMTERGCFNYRWPYNEYALLSNDGHDAEPRETGTCARVAFVKDNILYQLIRLEKGCRPEADRCHYVPWSGRITLAVGGPIEFAAFDADNACAKPKYDHLFEYSMQDGTRVTKGLTNQLEVRVRQLDGNEYVTLPLEQQEDDGAAGDSYVVHAELPEGDNVNIRGRQVILIAEFRLRKVDSQSPWPETPTSVQTFRYLGIHSDSPMATGVMWETIFFKREQESNYFSELPEANIIGRCVEKILTVDLVPTAFKSQGSFEFEENGPLALVSNLFLRPNIDLESLFWKVRFLVKAYQFLGKFKQLCSKTISKSNEDALGEEPKTFPLISHASDIELHHHEAKSTGYIETLVDRQMERLLKSIGRAIAYLARVFIQPKTQPNLKSKILQPSYYYIAMTLWYTMKRCSLSEFIQKWIVTDGMQSWSPDESLLVQSLPPENLQPKDKERGKMAFLKWYHYTSILSLCGEKDFLPEAWKKIKLDDKVSLLERDARRAVAVRLSMCKPYSAEDEILDRMGFLAESLNAESTHQAGSVASLTTRRMLDRDATRYLNPGRYSDGENGKTSGPWEIYALCHHSRLLVEEYKYSKDNKRTRKQKIEEADIYRRELSIFLNAEACLSPCWERTNSALFRSEATSVLASTLLGICQKDLSLGPQADERLESTYINTATSSMEIHRLRTQALRKVESTVPPAIEWKRYKPPHRHHDKFNNSLDRVYERTWILFSSLPGISNIRWPQPDLNESDVRYMLETYKVTVIDLKASIPDQWDNHTWQGYKSEVFTVDTLKPNKTATAMAKLSASGFSLSTRRCSIGQSSCENLGTGWPTLVSLGSFVASSMLHPGPVSSIIYRESRSFHIRMETFGSLE
ncbi:hypothetical protein F4821DRAFT_179586 [Hypoxylon rubiginosum]|uniref:Uncharacterized protein n=1 Tax=Hypoxylon rubiginosum TaxID=110542 RepID=A0ACC0CU64_9PEZI|nr:hypothetical protein F4821DRAFT_179586 [Hypoxylon rubiginosum]